MRRSRSRSIANFLFLCLCQSVIIQVCWSTTKRYDVCKDAWKWNLLSGTCIKNLGQKLNWTSARHACQHQKGDLLIINNKEMNDFVYDYLHPSKEAVFIGLNDVRVEGEFRWLDSDKKPNYTNFSGREPNGGTTSNCVQINNIWGRPTREWTDDDCALQAQFICERHQDLTKMCTDGWTKDHTSGMCIKTFLEGATWQEANNTCRSHEADLLIILNEDNNEFLSGFLTPITSSFWIGLNDIQAEGKYRWIDYMDEVEYAKLAFRRQPQVGQAECWSVHDPNRGWERKNCDFKQPFICEKFAENCGSQLGAACPENCSSCWGDVCNRRTGVCSLGCYSGYRGLKCTAKTSIEILETEKFSSCSKAYLVIDIDYQLVKFNISWDDLHYRIDKSDSPTVVNFTSGESLCPLIGQDNNCTLTTFQGYSCLCEEITLGEYHLTFNHTPNQPGDNFTLYMKWLGYNEYSHITSENYTLLKVHDHCTLSKSRDPDKSFIFLSILTKASIAFGVALAGVAVTGAGIFLASMGHHSMRVKAKAVDLKPDIKDGIPIGIYSTREGSEELETEDLPDADSDVSIPVDDNPSQLDFETAPPHNDIPDGPDM